MSNPYYVSPILGPVFRWNWADAAERLAETPNPAYEGGLFGYQADIQAVYQLLANGPVRWARQPDGLASVPLGFYCSPNTDPTTGATYIGTTPSIVASGGVLVAPNGANYATRLARGAFATAPGAGSISRWSAVQGGGGGVNSANGWRQFYRFVINNGAGASATMRWFAGTSGTVPAANVNPNTYLNAIGLGRTGVEANVQLFHNDAAGVATQIDLGANFPHGNGEGYELELFTEDGTDYRYQVTNLNTSAQVSGILAADIPPNNTNTTRWQFYASNNADAVVVYLEVASYFFQQRQLVQ